MDDAGGDPFSIRYGGAVGSRARLVANRVARRIRAALSAGPGGCGWLGQSAVSGRSR
jgi:hypothetical protein